MAFHETGKMASKKQTSLLWKKKRKVFDSFLVTSEIDTGAGIFDDSSICTLNIKSLLPELDHFVSKKLKFP